MKKLQYLQNCKPPEIPEELKKVFKEVIEKLVKTDTVLAEVSISDAKATKIQNPKYEKIVKHLIEKAEKEFNKTKEELEKNRPDKAINNEII